MILSLFHEMTNDNKNPCIHNFYCEKTGNRLAYAQGNEKYRMTLYFDNRAFEIGSMPKLLQRVDYNFPYPVSSKSKKTFGYDIFVDDKVYLQYYGEAITCGKKGIFKRNIGLTVFNFFDSAFAVYKVGLPRDSSHYYCMYDNNNVLVGVIERHSGAKDGRKATLYLDDEKFLLPLLIVCTEEIVSFANTTGRVDVDRTFHDRSAGNYISIFDEEKKLFDRNFIESIKSKQS